MKQSKIQLILKENKSLKERIFELESKNSQLKKYESLTIHLKGKNDIITQFLEESEQSCNLELETIKSTNNQHLLSIKGLFIDIITNKLFFINKLIQKLKYCNTEEENDNQSICNKKSY